MFKSLDNNKNKTLDASELENGLRDFGINLNGEQIDVLVKHFDKDGTKTISFNEFLQAIRVSKMIVNLIFILGIGSFERIKNWMDKVSLLET